jgi:ubiquinone/menaquinone biosynthesis C-methylase UbiE
MLGGLLRLRPMPVSQTAVAMVGARSGDRVLVVGADEAWLPAELAKATHLTGHVIVADRAEAARKRVEAAAERAGAFFEFEDAPPTKLPFPDDDFNIVVANHRLSRLNDSDRVQCLAELRRVLKPGGRRSPSKLPRSLVSSACFPRAPRHFDRRPAGSIRTRAGAPRASWRRRTASFIWKR